MVTSLDPTNSAGGLPQPPIQACLLSFTCPVRGTDALPGLALGTYRVEAEGGNATVRHGPGEPVLPGLVERRVSQEGMGSHCVLEPAPTNLGWLVTSLRKPIAYVSSQFQVRQSHTGRLKLAMMGVLAPQKLTEAKIRAVFFFFSPESQLLNVIETPLVSGIILAA